MIFEVERSIVASTVPAMIHLAGAQVVQVLQRRQIFLYLRQEVTGRGSGSDSVTEGGMCNQRPIV
jgi:hypothetical protein